MEIIQGLLIILPLSKMLSQTQIQMSLRIIQLNLTKTVMEIISPITTTIMVMIMGIMMIMIISTLQDSEDSTALIMGSVTIALPTGISIGMITPHIPME